MNAIEFLSAVQKRVVEETHFDYRMMLDQPEAKDPTWKGVTRLYQALSTDQQTQFLSFIKLIQANTVSHLFGILDGSSYLNETREEFILQASSTKEKLNGDLQDLLLQIGD